MDPSDIYLLLILLILLYLSSFFSSSETALITVNRHRLRARAEDGDARAQLVLDILDDQTKMLTAILIGNNIVNLSASALTTVITARLGGNLGVAAGTGALTFLILLFGEISPKNAATIRSEKLALRNAPIIRFLMTVLTPLIYLITFFSELCIRYVFRVNPHEKEAAMTEAELRTIVEVSHEEGIIETDEKQMINNVFDLGDTRARDVMLPRTDVVFVDVEATYEEVLDAFQDGYHTRIPVYEETSDNVVGIINMKDLVLYQRETPFHVRDFLKDALYVHEFKNVDELLLEMRNRRVTMSVVLDEYGSTVGIVTMEDILEEIVGEIRDEYDEDEMQDLQKLSDTEYRIAGSFKLDDLNDVLHTGLVSEDYNSIGGYLVGLLDHFPEQGEEFTTTDGYRLVAEKVDRNRIESVHLYLPSGSSAAAPENHE